ncbi:ribosomal protein S18 [Xylaria intraflava]|nr:ribosomal protein S18 [Xylaria intraflava]
MPPRAPALSALRQGLSSLKAAPLSTTAAPKALRDTNPPNNHASLLSGSFGPEDPNPTALVQDLYKTMRSGRTRGSEQERGKLEDDMVKRNRNDDYMRHLARRWHLGDVYSPHDMSPSEMSKWRQNSAPKKDIVRLLGLRPLDMYRNFTVISEFMTPHGRIKPASETGLSAANQRKMAKAIRRAIGLGLHPSVHRHPELLMRGL